MSLDRCQSLIDAVRGLGPETYNRLVESLDETRLVGRLRFWQEELFERLALGGPPVSFDELLAAFAGARPLPVPPLGGRPPRVKQHALLGEVRYDEDDEAWTATIPLPSLAPYGQPVVDEHLGMRGDDFVASAEQYRRGLFGVVIHAGKRGPTAPQDAALRHLIDHEPAVCRRVLSELATEWKTDLEAMRERVWCCQVEVADRAMSGGHLKGKAYLGFVFSQGAYEECPICVVYHPDRGTWWAQSTLDEALADA